MQECTVLYNFVLHVGFTHCNRPCGHASPSSTSEPPHSIQSTHSHYFTQAPQPATNLSVTRGSGFCFAALRFPGAWSAAVPPLDGLLSSRCRNAGAGTQARRTRLGSSCGGTTSGHAPGTCPKRREVALPASELPLFGPIHLVVMLSGDRIRSVVLRFVALFGMTHHDSEGCFYPGGVAGRHCDYRHSDCIAATGRSGAQGKRPEGYSAAIT